jgi:two-component system sensor histidine kinase VicK
METIEVIHGDDRVVNTILEFISNANTKIDACVDSSRPSLALDIERIKLSIDKARDNKIKIRCITEITKDNLHYCKKLIDIVDEPSCRRN